MKKVLMLAAVAGLVLSSTALAQNSCLWLDVRDNSSTAQLINTPTYPYTVGALNLGKAGDAQTLYLQPHYSDSYETSTWTKNGWPNTDGDADGHTGCFWLYADVYNADAGGTGVISSIGLDFNFTNPAAPKNALASVSFAWDAAVFAGTNMGKVPGASVGTPITAWAGARAVHVPVLGTPPAFDATGGLVPGATPPTRYKLGKLSVVAGNRSCTYAAGHDTASTYTVRMAVNSLLITRAFSGAAPDPVENVAFGYAAGVPESPYAAGNVSGATSTAADGTITIQIKGDNNGDGRVLSTDTGPYLTAKAAGLACTQRQVFINDFNGDRRVLSTDTGPYLNAKTHSPSGCGPF